MITYAKRLRVNRGLSLSEVCEATGVSFLTLKSLEQGNEIGAKQLRAIGDFYGVEPAALLPVPTSEPEAAA